MDFSGNIVLTPVASVDTTNCSVTMNVFIPSDFYSDNTLIQIEYNIYDMSFSSSGFLSYESGWSQPGISNQLIIGIPCTDEPIDYSGSTNVRIRAYFGSLSQPAITVTDWSNSQPFYNPPEEPVISSAFLSSGDSHSPPDDIISILLEDNPNYYGSLSDTDPAVKFIVSYNYTDLSGNIQWEVSSLINGEKVTVNTDSFILLEPISFVGVSADIDPSFNVNVAVNAVYEFPSSEDVDSFYYSVSTISETVQTQQLLPGAAVLGPLVYHIYDATPSQSITLNWSVPVESLFLQITSYVVFLSINGQPYQPISGNIDPNTRTYTWDITPPSLYLVEGTTNTLSFVVNTYYDTQYYPSNQVDIQTFMYATHPLDLNYRYAVPTTNDGVDGVDIIFTFKNPFNIGQGTNPVFYYNIVMSDGTTIPTGTVPYVATNPHTYTVNAFVPDTTATTGTISVYMKTNNTNPEYQQLSGPTATVSFNVINVPIIESISVVGTVLNVVILSGEVLGTNNQLVFNYSNTLTKLSFDTSYVGPQYTVIELPLDNGTIQYTFEFNSSFFPGSATPTNVVVCASNSAGIGARIYPYVV